MRKFAELGIQEPFIRALADMGIDTPTDIQVKAIPFLVSTGTDFIGQAQTGTGKTAAFGLPLLEKVDASNGSIQGLILSPTRELCQQISKSLFRYTKYVDQKIFVEAVYGGAKIDAQVASLTRPTQVLVATPGRLVDLLERRAVDLSNVTTVVLDEADEMLSMGFKDELDRILSHLSKNRATWLFSATIPSGIQHIIDTHMHPDAFRIRSEKVEVINRNITHQYVLTTRDDKLTMLRRFLDSQGENRGVIFCRTKADTQTVASKLAERGVAADSLHGDLLQKERDKVMRAFKKSRFQVLVATDLAARGIDVASLAFVVQYDVPEQVDYYTHRSGRTARAGNKGLSLTFVGSNEVAKLQSIERALDISIKKVTL